MQISSTRSEMVAPKILAFGDSLTFGIGGAGQSYPDVLEARLRAPVINAGRPGELTAGGVSRLPRTLDRTRPQIVVLCLGTNDFLRGTPDDEISANLEAMVAQVRSRGIRLLLLAVARPGEWEAAPVFDSVPESTSVIVDADALVAVARNPLNKADPVHLNAQGYALLAEQVHDALLGASWVAPR